MLMRKRKRLPGSCNICPLAAHHKLAPPANTPTRLGLQKLLPHVVVHRQVGQQEVAQLQRVALKAAGLGQGDGGLNKLLSWGGWAQQSHLGATRVG